MTDEYSIWFLKYYCYEDDCILDTLSKRLQNENN